MVIQSVSYRPFSLVSPLSVAKKPSLFFGSNTTESLNFKPDANTRIIVITDFRDGTSNTQVQQRLHSAFQHVAQPWKNLSRVFRAIVPKEASPQQSPQIQAIQDIPLFNRDYQALSLLRLGSETNNDIFVHVTDPGVHGVGGGHSAQAIKGNERSVLVTQGHGVYVGPNNGSLGLIGAALKARRIPFSLRELDLKRIGQLEKSRTGQPVVATFNGRDIFAPVAAWLARGIDVNAFSKPGTIDIIPSQFNRPAAIPNKVGDTTKAVAVVDNTSGNLKTSVALTQAELNRFTRKNPWLLVSLPESNQTVLVPVKHTFAEVPVGKPLAYLGSTFAPDGKRQYLELAVNQGDLGQRLQVSPTHAAKPITLTHIRQPESI